MMTMNKLIIMGANNPEIIKLIDSINRSATYSKIDIIGFIDNDLHKKGALFMEKYPILGPPNILANEEYKDIFLVNNITRDCDTRRITTEQILQFNHKLMTLVHPSVDMKYVETGMGLVIHDGCIIGPRVRIEDYCALMLGAQIGHDCLIGKNCFIGPKANICGVVHIEKESFIGAGAVILPRLSIGESSKIGAGAVVMSNVPAGSIVVGNPARVIPS